MIITKFTLNLPHRLADKSSNEWQQLSTRRNRTFQSNISSIFFRVRESFLSRKYSSNLHLMIEPMVSYFFKGHRDSQISSETVRKRSSISWIRFSFIIVPSSRKKIPSPSVPWMFDSKLLSRQYCANLLLSPCKNCAPQSIQSLFHGTEWILPPTTSCAVK